MSNPTSVGSKNRRQETRYRGQCRRIIWRKTEGEPTPGVLCDYSASGASFMVTANDRKTLKAGEHIVLRRASAAAETQVYQVRRVEQLGFGYLLAGCCRAIAVESVHNGVRLPSLSTAANPPHVHLSFAPNKAVGFGEWIQNTSSIAAAFTLFLNEMRESLQRRYDV